MRFEPNLGQSDPRVKFLSRGQGYTLFITPGEKVYEGMIIGEHCRENDLIVNPCKTKKLTNVRAKGKEMTVILTPVTAVSLESGIEFIRDDELVEVTPKSIRLRKARLFTGKPLPERLQD